MIWCAVIYFVRVMKIRNPHVIKAVHIPGGFTLIRAPGRPSRYAVRSGDASSSCRFKRDRPKRRAYLA